ncbi:myrosinase 1-like [Thrips palmi]|uniref:Myrosinase 1-like n=1 Tax=Thrips palmi TaxID=161013 RepID=A0A6P8Y7P2_THRPL|nr:myrosinase 1-like [Thrips palmi]
MRALCFLTLVVAAVAAAPDSLRATDDPNDPAFDYTFPDGFYFSSATASYQVEGAWNASGKGENIWDRTTHEHPELVLDRSNGDIACDSYHKFKEDIQLVKELGSNMYRFSLSWSRLLPKGTIDVKNDDGIRYYNDVIDECIANNIIPMVTIFHWDLPQPLQDLGGFTNDIIVDFFQDYADFVFQTFGDRVKWWLTLNEPWTTCVEGYGNGGKAPVVLAEGRGDYLCAHNSLKAHARAYRLYETKYKQSQQGKVGFAANSDYFWPKDPNNADDVAAAQRWMQFNWGWFTHPVFSKEGNYPQDMIDYIDAASTKQGLARSRLPKFTAEEIEMIKGSADFCGVNSYTSTVVAQLQPSDPQPEVGTRASDAAIVTSRDPSWEATIAPWHYVVPTGLRKLLNWIRTEYDNPNVIITENGYPDSGQLKDVNRVRYYRLYILELLKAMTEDKCNVFGYTAWSLMDNYEWFYGYAHKFGIYHVDFEDPNRPRTQKMSAKFYQRLIATRKVPRDGDIVFPDDPTSTARPATTARPNTSATRAATSTARSATDALPNSSASIGGVMTLVLVATLLSLLGC